MLSVVAGLRLFLLFSTARRSRREPSCRQLLSSDNTDETGKRQPMIDLTGLSG
jgi:hypothetical protein